MKEAEKYAQDMAIYYESAHGYIPSQFEKYLREAVKYGYNKANEWHNIKENPNDLPNDGELVVADNGLAIDCVKFRKNEFGNSWKHDNFELYDVIYWKKLVLSKDRNK